MITHPPLSRFSASMPLRKVENAAQRCRDAVEAIAKLTLERDALIDKVRRRVVVADGAAPSSPTNSAGGSSSALDELDAQVEAIEQVKYAQLLRLHEQAAVIARSVQDSARVSEHASRQVKSLDVLLERVQAAKRIADSLLAQQQNVRLVATALEQGDIEQAVTCVTTYRKAKTALAGIAVDDENRQVSVSMSNRLAGSDKVEGAGEKDEDELHDVVIVDRDELMSGATTDLQTRIETLLSSAIHRQDKSNVMKYCSMLSDLGLGEDSSATYRTFICDGTTKLLNQMIDKELRAMEQSPSSSLSHLALVSNGLDMIVATFEQEEAFVQDVFGKSAGVAKLLLDLHTKCTSHCVRVLQDFLKRRKIQSASAAVTNSPETHASGASQQWRKTGGSGEEPKVLDQRLEDIAHLVSCCHLYLRFMEDRYRSACGQNDSTAVSSAITHDNALSDMVQELLSIYIPMQVEYLDAAFNQALKIQLSAASSSQQQGKAAGTSEAATGGGFIDVLASLYQSNESSNSDDAATAASFGIAQWEHLRNDVIEIGLVDDVFYFLRVAIHRAIGTKTSSIISSVIIGVGELIQDRLLKELERFAVTWSRTREASAHSVPPVALKWLCAAQRAVNYTRRLGEEVAGLTSTGNGFSASDTVRFSEQKLDLDAVADAMCKSTAGWITKFAAVAAASMCTRLERFVSTPYHTMSEEGFLRSEMTDLWAAAAVVHWGHALDYYQAFLDEESYLQFISDLLTKLVRQLEEAVGKKSYNGFGALQLDKDLRTIKSFFVERADCPVRDKFARLTSIVSLLMVDHPSDALSEPSSEILSAEERRRTLLLRADFGKDQVLALKFQ